MTGMEWQRVTDRLYTCSSGKWTFKRFQSGNSTIWSIWKGDEMKFSTHHEHEFLSKAEVVLSDVPEWWYV